MILYIILYIFITKWPELTVCALIHTGQHSRSNTRSKHWHYWRICNTSNILTLLVRYEKTGYGYPPSGIPIRNIRTFDVLKLLCGAGPSFGSSGSDFRGASKKHFQFNSKTTSFSWNCFILGILSTSNWSPRLQNVSFTLSSQLESSSKNVCDDLSTKFKTAYLDLYLPRLGILKIVGENSFSDVVLIHIIKLAWRNDKLPGRWVQYWWDDLWSSKRGNHNSLLQRKLCF